MSVEIQLKVAKDRAWVEIDNELFRELSFPLYRRQKTQAQLFANREDATQWLFDLELKLAKGYAYWLLARKSYSEKQLREKIISRGASLVADALIEECKQRKYLNDNELLQRRVEAFLAKGKGPRWIGFRLQREFSKDSIEQCLQKVTPAKQREVIRNILKKSSGDSQKIFRTLYQRGFECELISCEIQSWEKACK